MVSFLQVSPPEPCAHLSSPPYAPLSVYSLNKIYGRFMDRRVLQVWLYCSLLWLSRYVPRNFNNISSVEFSGICEVICELNFDGSLLQQISVQYMERYVGYTEQPIYSLSQGCTNRGHQAARTPTFFKVAPSLYGFSVWDLLHIILLARRIFK